MDTLPGRARMLRPPKARGPYSIRPWNQRTILPSAISPAVREAMSGTRSIFKPGNAARATQGIMPAPQKGSQRTWGPSPSVATWAIPATNSKNCVARTMVKGTFAALIRDFSSIPERTSNLLKTSAILSNDVFMTA